MRSPEATAARNWPLVEEAADCQAGLPAGSPLVRTVHEAPLSIEV